MNGSVRACGRVLDEHAEDGPCQASVPEFDFPGDSPVQVDELPCRCIHFEEEPEYA